MTPFQIVAFGLASGSGMAFLWVVFQNWRVVVTALRRPGTPRPSLIFLAGPILVVLLVQGLRYAGAPLSGRELALVALVGLTVDPAALPMLLFAMVRWVRRRIGRGG